MVRAALLIDWDNFRTSLNQQQYHCYESSDIVRQLRTAVERIAAERGAGDLGYTRLYAPPRAFDSPHRDRLVDLGIEVVDTTANKQAADADMMVHAFDLLNESKGNKVQLFFVVTGDVDFVPLARNLENRSAECYLLPVSDRHINRATAAWHRLVFVRDLLELDPCPAIGVEQLWLLALGAHLVIDRDGQTLWGYHKTIDALVQMQVLGQRSEVTAVWDEAVTRGYFRQDYVGDRPRRRLAYERPEVNQILGLADLALGPMRRRNGPQPMRGELVPPINHPLVRRSEDQSAIVEALLQVGYLYESDGRVTCAFPSAKFGLINPLLDVIAAAGIETEKRGWESIPRAVIARDWARFVTPGGRVQDPHATLEQGHDMVTRAVAAGALYPRFVNVDGRKIRSMFLRHEHPLVRRVDDAHRCIARVLSRSSTRRVPTDAVVQGMLAETNQPTGSSPLEALRWLGRFGAARAINWYQDKVEYRRDCRSLRWWTAGQQ